MPLAATLFLNDTKTNFILYFYNLTVSTKFSVIILKLKRYSDDYKVKYCPILSSELFAVSIFVNAKRPSKHSFTHLFCSVDQTPFAQLLYNSIQWIGHYPKYKIYFTLNVGRRGSLMGSALDSGVSGLGSGPGQGYCVVFLGKTLYSHGASLHPGV